MKGFKQCEKGHFYNEQLSECNYCPTPSTGATTNSDETELINYIDKKKVSFAGLDTFENEPTPSVKLLMHPKISLSPHIGAATSEAQDRIGIELADQVINYFNND